MRVHEAVLGKGEVVLRAWSGKAPDGWKPPKEQKRGPLEEAIALAYVPLEASRLGTELAVRIRGRNEPAMVVRRPFYRRN